MEYNGIEIGNRANEIRKTKNIKQSDICKTLGIAQSSYSRFENGQYSMPVDKFIKLCDILDISVSWLLGENIIAELTDDECLILENIIKSIKKIRRKNNRNKNSPGQ